MSDLSTMVGEQQWLRHLRDKHFMGFFAGITWLSISTDTELNRHGARLLVQFAQICCVHPIFASSVVIEDGSLGLDCRRTTAQLQDARY